MTVAEVSAALAKAGLAMPPEAITVVMREDRWMARLPGDLVAWFPANNAGARRMATEGLVLDLLAARCSFEVPRVLFRSPDGWQVRTIVPGICEPSHLHERVRRERALGRHIGHDIGTMLAEQHTTIHAHDAAAWLPRRAPWPEPNEKLWRTLRDMVDDAGLLHRINRVLRRYEAEDAGSTDRVLVHGDLGFRNIAFDPATDPALQRRLRDRLPRGTPRHSTRCAALWAYSDRGCRLGRTRTRRLGRRLTRYSGRSATSSRTGRAVCGRDTPLPFPHSAISGLIRYARFRPAPAC